MMTSLSTSLFVATAVVATLSLARPRAAIGQAQPVGPKSAVGAKPTSLSAVAPITNKTYAIVNEAKFVNIAFESRMEVEDIIGTTHTANGAITLGAKPAFEIKIPVASLRTGIDLRDEHLRSAKWLDATTFPEIVFRGTAVTPGENSSYQLAGDLVVHGVAKKVTITVDTKQIPASVGQTLGLPPGDWVRARAKFTIKLSDHGIAIPSTTAAKVSDAWAVQVSLFAKEVK